MDDSGDICACIACSALCGLCCAIAAEEDRRERERNMAATKHTTDGDNNVTYVDPVQVHKDGLDKIHSRKKDPRVYSPGAKPKPYKYGKLPSAV